MVGVYRDGNKTPINGTSTDAKGVFTLTQLPFDSFRLTVDFMGYKPVAVGNIRLSRNKPSIDLGSIKLAYFAQVLKDITITGEKDLIETKADKLVYNAERDLTSQGGVATDLLKKIPLLSVDIDGNIQLQGASNVQILINGKTSAIFSNNPSEALQSIPASQIKSIEVITSPGAKYDAEGTGGIINIILKENKFKGANGTMNLSAGTRLNNGSVTFNARRGFFGFNASFGGNAQLKSTTLNSLSRNSTDSAGYHYQLNQDGQGNVIRHSYRGLIGFEWDMRNNNQLSGSLGYNFFKSMNRGLTEQQQSVSPFNPAWLPGYDWQTSRNASNYFSFHSLEGHLDYIKKYKTEGKELDISYQSHQYSTPTYFSQHQEYTANDSVFTGAQSGNAVRGNENIIQLDFVQPLKKEAKIELGAKATLSQITSHSDYYDLIPASQEYHFDSAGLDHFYYNRNIYALYASFDFRLLKAVDVKIGGRLERTFTQANFQASSPVMIPPYNFFMPTLTVSRSLTSSQVLKLSYSRRIQRPGSRSLNPFINATDPSNITTGNPNLKPELVHYAELAYTKTFTNGGSLVSSVFGRYSTQDLQGYEYFHSGLKIADSTYLNVTVNTTENVGIQNVAGVNFFGSVPVTPTLTLRGSIAFFDLYIKNKLLPDDQVNSVNYRSNINATYQPNHDIAFEFFGNFRSPWHEIQGSSKSFVTYSFAFRKYLWNQKGSIGFTTTNPFNHYVDLKTSLTGRDFSMVSDRKVVYQSFGIIFTYKFGKLQFKKDTDENPDQNNLPEN